jgi:hypothetical protein
MSNEGEPNRHPRRDEQLHPPAQFECFADISQPSVFNVHPTQGNFPENLTTSKEQRLMKRTLIGCLDQFGFIGEWR